MPKPAKPPAEKPTCPCCGKAMTWERKLQRPPTWWEMITTQQRTPPATGPPAKLSVTQVRPQAM